MESPGPRDHQYQGPVRGRGRAQLQGPRHGGAPGSVGRSKGVRAARAGSAHVRVLSLHVPLRRDAGGARAASVGAGRGGRAQSSAQDEGIRPGAASWRAVSSRVSDGPSFPTRKGSSGGRDPRRGMMKNRPQSSRGLSGSGKSFAAKCFEDMGYYCVDNMPIRLIPTFIDLIDPHAGRHQPDCAGDRHPGGGVPEATSPRS